MLHKLISLRPRFSSRFLSFAIIAAIELVLLMNVMVFGASDTRLAFVDSATEFFGLKSSVAPVFFNWSEGVTWPQITSPLSTFADEINYNAPTSPSNMYVPNTFTDPVITTLNNATGQINGGATISLRSALTAADNLGGTHTVNLSTGTYNLTQAIPNRQITIGNTNQNITINGNGPANTIINNTLDANKDRILFINPTGTTNSPVITVNGIRFQNAFLSSDPYGGAAICAGGGSAESLTVTNCAFDNNVIPANGYGGAAVCMQVRGNLTIDNSTFTNNVSNDADGGAVLFIIFGSTLGTGFGTLSVTNSTFSGNSVIFPGAGTSNGGALAFTGQGGSTPFNATINNNTFITNTADGLGGAISANNSPNVSTPQIHFNRFFNNTSTASALSSGLHFVESSGSVNAENNWWGCSSNPVNGVSTAPCNQAGGDVAGGGALDANPWLQLRTAASPGSIVTNQTTSLTTSFLANSDGTAVTLANIATLIGRPVTWSSLGGNLSSQQTTIQAAGTATATYSETTGVAGTHSATAVVDSGPASGSTNTAAITVTKANTTATVTSNLSTATVTGQSYTVAFSVVAAFGFSPTAATGNVQVSDGSQTCSSTINGGGTGSCLLTSTSAGNKTITATFLGDANFNSSPASAGVAHTVNKADTTTTITNSGSLGTATVVGQPYAVNWSVTVNPPGSVGVALTGNITVSDGSQSCMAAVSAGTCNLTSTSPGVKTITASYPGDANYNPSPTSAGVSHTVNKANTTSAITADSPDPSVYGQNYTVTANVTVNAPGAGTPTGSITVSDGTNNCTITLPATTCGLPSTAPAVLNLTATYNGDTNFNPSPASAGVAHTVNKANTTTAITNGSTLANATFTNVAYAVNWTVTVNAPGAGALTGNVTASDGTAGCTAPFSAGTCNITSTTPGAKSITAMYMGDANFNLSTSAGVSHQVNASTISGTVTYANAIGAPVPRFVSKVTIGGAGSPNVSTTTAAPGAGEGTYTLTGFGSGNYTVAPSKATGVNSISSFDAALVSQHVAGPPNPQLNSTQLTVADVSGNGSVTSFDAGMIAKFVAGPPFTTPGIGATATWRFGPLSRNYSTVASAITAQDYTAFLMGEVSGNWTNTGARPLELEGRGQVAEGTGPERTIVFVLPQVVSPVGKEIIVPVHALGVANKGVISYEFNLRYDPSVIQPLAESVDLKDSISRGLSVVANPYEPGLLRVVVYGPMPIDENGVLLNLRFTAVGAPGSVSPLSFERIMFNEVEYRVDLTDGRVELIETEN